MSSVNYNYQQLINSRFGKTASNIVLQLNGSQSNNLSLCNLFAAANKSNLYKIDLQNLNDIQDLSKLCSDCSQLNNIDVSTGNIHTVTNMSQIFSSCGNLTSLDVANGNTSNVIDLSYGFSRCSNLTALNCFNWNTINLTNMDSTFCYCSKLQSLDLSTGDTYNLQTLASTFQSCSSLNSLNIMNGNTINLTNLYNTFCYCKNLHDLDISSGDLSNVTNMKYTFGGCQGLTNSTLLNIGKAISIINAGDKPFNNLYNNNSEGMFYMSYNGINANVLNATTILALRNNGGIFEGMNEPIITYRLSYIDNMNQSGYIDFGKYNDLQNYIKTTDLVFSEISISDEEV